jgi:hypothetical protein
MPDIHAVGEIDQRDRDRAQRLTLTEGVFSARAKSRLRC